MNELEAIKELSIWQLASLVAALGGPTSVDRILDDKYFVSVEPWERRYQIVVDYSRPFADVVNAGNYDHVYALDRLEKAYPASGEGVVELDVHLVYRYLPNGMSTEEALARIGQQSRPATLFELLAFRAAHRYARWQFPIAALGSTDGEPGTVNARVPFIGVSPSAPEDGFVLHDIMAGGTWHPEYRFLAVRK